MTVEANLKFYCKLYGKVTLIDRYKDELEVAAYLKHKASVFGNEATCGFIYRLENCFR